MRELFFFFLMIRPPPKSTLFPSPTLFRSAPMTSRGAVTGVVQVSIPRLWVDQALEEVWKALGEADRKSTRLNSSHGYISYAVFCLKKKKNNIQLALYRATYRSMSTAIRLT